MHTYELVFIADPRIADEDVVAMTEEYKNMIVAGGAEITQEENWGRRKLAYPIRKLSEGKYVVLYISSATGKTALPEVEHRLQQNEKVLRFLTVRTDLDLKRAEGRKRPPRRQPAFDDGRPVPEGPLDEADDLVEKED